jgi:hypothetical protein
VADDGQGRNGDSVRVERLRAGSGLRSAMSWLGHSPRASMDALLGVVLLLCFAAPLLGRDSSLRMEAAEIGLARLPLAEAWWAIERGVVETPSPLGHLATRFALVPGVWGARLLSLVLGAAAVVVIGRLARGFFGPWEATIATVTAATVPVVAVLSSSAGTLSLFLLLSAVSLHSWQAGLSAGGRWSWPVFIVSGIMMLYTHHMGLLLLLAQAGAVGIDALVWSLTQHRTRRSRSGLPYIQYLFSLAVIVLAFLPWMLNKDVFPRGYAESSHELVVVSPSSLGTLLTDLTAGLPAMAPAYGMVLLLGIWDALRRRRASGPRGKLYVDTRHRRPMTLLLVAAVVFFPAAVAASYASRVALDPRSLAPLVAMGAALLARGVTALAGRTWRDSAWALRRRSVAVAGCVVIAGLSTVGHFQGAANRIGGGREATTRLREFLRGSVQEGDLLAVSGRSDIVGLAAWAAPDAVEVTAAWSQHPGELLSKVAAHEATMFLSRDVVDRSGTLSEQVVIERSVLVGLIDVGTDEARRALRDGWGPSIVPPEPCSRANVQGLRATIQVRLQGLAPNAVVLHTFTKEAPQTMSVIVNGVPSGKAAIQKGWSVTAVPVEDRAFRRRADNVLTFGFSDLNAPQVKWAKPWSVSVVMIVLERRMKPVSLELQADLMP